MKRLLLAAIALGHLPCLAQTPDGWLVLGSFRDSSAPGIGGVFFVDPLAPTNILSVTGLPPDVTGANSSGLVGNDVMLRLPDERIIVTAWGQGVGIPHPLYVLTINGTSVTNSVSYDLGTITNLNGLAVPQVALLPDGKILVAVDPSNLGVAGEPLFNVRLGIVDPDLPPNDPAAIQPIPGTALPGANRTNGLAYDPATGDAYVGTDTGEIYRFAVPAGGTPTLVANAPGCNNLAIDNQGRLLIANGNGGLYRVDAGTLTQLPQVTRGMNAVRVDPVTETIYMMEGDELSSLAPPSPTTGVLNVLSAGPATGWGRIAGMDINPILEEFGSSSGGPVRPEWQIYPNAGGVPTLGNGSFSLEVTAPSAPVFSGLLLSTGPATIPTVFQGMDILVQVPFVDGIAFGSGTSMTIPLPIPSAANLQGTSWAAQTIHADTNGRFSASSGLMFSLR